MTGDTKLLESRERDFLKRKEKSTHQSLYKQEWKDQTNWFEKPTFQAPA